jgi:hypothetical protein
MWRMPKRRSSGLEYSGRLFVSDKLTLGDKHGGAATYNWWMVRSCFATRVLMHWCLPMVAFIWRKMACCSGLAIVLPM